MDIKRLTELANLDLENFTPSSENNVKYKIVIPFLKSFHYKELTLEHAAQGSRIDINIDNKIIVETKALDQNLNNYVQQLKDYCGREEPVLAILTNGRSFRLYSPHWRYKNSFVDKLIYNFELSDLENEGLLKRLDLIIGFKNFESREYLEHIDKREKELLSITIEIEKLSRLNSNKIEKIDIEISEMKTEIERLKNKLSSKEQEKNEIKHNRDPEIEKLLNDYFVPQNETQKLILPDSERLNPILPDDTLVIRKKKKDIFAFGKQLEDKTFIVFKGSTISLIPAPKFETSNPSGFKLRKKYIEDGTIVDRVFTKDIIFNKISTAAGVIIGSSANGNDEWEKQ